MLPRRTVYLLLLQVHLLERIFQDPLSCQAIPLWRKAIKLMKTMYQVHQSLPLTEHLFQIFPLPELLLPLNPWLQILNHLLHNRQVFCVPTRSVLKLSSPLYFQASCSTLFPIFLELSVFYHFLLLPELFQQEVSFLQTIV